MSAARLLERLARVSRTGRGRWRARCPAHEDSTPSLSIREEQDGRVLVHCFAGCAVHDVLHAVGLDLSDLFPSGPLAHRLRAIPQSLYLGDVVRALKFEVHLACLILSDVAAGRELTAADRERAGVASDRVLRFLEAVEHATH